MKRKRLWLGGGVLALLVLGGVAFWATRPDRFTPPAVPSPNGYDDLLRAAAMVDPATDRWDEKSPEELATIVGNNAAAIRIVRSAVVRPSVVPIDWEGADSPQAFELHSLRTQLLRSVYRALQAEHQHAVLSGDNTAALEASLNLARLSAAASRGGLMIDHVIGYAYRSVAAQDLYQLADQLDAQHCGRVADAWGRIEWPTATVDELLERDKHFVQQSLGTWKRMILTLHSGTMARLAAPAKKVWTAAKQRHAAESALLRTRFAIRRFELENGGPPKALDELTTEYLAELIDDPFGTGPLKYVLHDEGSFDLYSVGANAVDEGGADSNQPEQGDVNLAKQAVLTDSPAVEHSSGEQEVPAATTDAPTTKSDGEQLER